MKQRLALRALAELMDWSDEAARTEFAWLRLMSRLKYDGYHDYLAGVRFIESLVTWLRQFKAADRERAYRLARKRLVFVSSIEMRRLVERFYPREVEPRLVRAAAAVCSVPSYRVWAQSATVDTVRRLRRQTLFMGLSDGARMDVFRRVNTGVISNEQTVLAPLVDHDKWRDLATELAKDPLMSGVAKPRFTHLYLIDDLTASSTTLIRYDDEKKQWKGKLPKLWTALNAARSVLSDEFPIADDVTVCVHHYIATSSAIELARTLDAQARAQVPGWFSPIHFSTGHALDDRARLDSPADDEFLKLADDYYDPALENEHSAASGIKDMRYGYKQCKLTVILEHNTPNNALSLLWAETAGKDGHHPMRPLFRRRSRHV